MKNIRINSKKNLSASSEEPSPYLAQALKDSERDLAEGYVSPTFDNAKDAIAWLEDPNARYENGKKV